MIATPKAPEGEADQLSRAVAKVEAVSSVEVVVALARRAEAYPDVPWKLAALAGSVALLAVVFMPWSVSEGMGLLATLAVAASAGLGLGGHPVAVRALTLPRRRQRAVEAYAKQVFVDEAVGGTRDRTGILVLHCELERRVEVLPDAGVQRRVPEGDFLPLEEACSTDLATGRAPEPCVAALIESLAALVEGPLPRAEDDQNELPDAPRRL